MATAAAHSHYNNVAEIITQPDEKSLGISKRIADLLEARHISQPQFAKMCGMSKQYMNFLLNGKRAWNERTLHAAAKALNMPLSKLWNETELPGVDAVDVTATIGVEQYRKIKAVADQRMLSVEEYLRFALGEQIERDASRYSS